MARFHCGAGITVRVNNGVSTMTIDGEVIDVTRFVPCSDRADIIHWWAPVCADTSKLREMAAQAKRTNKPLTARVREGWTSSKAAA